MARFVCPGQGCGREFKSNAALSAHKRACRVKIAASAKLLLDKRQAAKVQQQEGKDADIELQEFVNDPVEENKEIIEHWPRVCRIFHLLSCSTVLTCWNHDQLARAHTSPGIQGFWITTPSHTSACTVSR
jgi:hypothetical protein